MVAPPIPKTTEDVLARSTFCRLGPYVWVRARRVGRPERHLLVTRDDREITVVTRQADLEDLEIEATNPDRWELLSIDCANPFYCVGFVARIAGALSAAGLDILFVSTFSRDWVFLKEADAARGAEVLASIGLVDETWKLGPDP